MQSKTKQLYTNSFDTFYIKIEVNHMVCWITWCVELYSVSFFKFWNLWSWVVKLKRFLAWNLIFFQVACWKFNKVFLLLENLAQITLQNQMSPKKIKFKLKAEKLAVFLKLFSILFFSIFKIELDFLHFTKKKHRKLLDFRCFINGSLLNLPNGWFSIFRRLETHGPFCLVHVAFFLTTCWSYACMQMNG